MKKILLTLVLAASLQAETFGYGDLHTMGSYPMAGLGIRSKTGIHALDFSGNICLWPSPTSFHVKALYIVYPQDEGFYLGCGIGVVNASSEIDDFTGSFEAAAGYQWEIPRDHSLFLEASALYPFQPIGESTWLRLLPGLTFGLGF